MIDNWYGIAFVLKEAQNVIFSGFWRHWVKMIQTMMTWLLELCVNFEKNYLDLINFYAELPAFDIFNSLRLLCNFISLWDDHAFKSKLQIILCSKKEKQKYFISSQRLEKHNVRSKW